MLFGRKSLQSFQHFGRKTLKGIHSFSRKYNIPGLLRKGINTIQDIKSFIDNPSSNLKKLIKDGSDFLDNIVDESFNENKMKNMKSSIEK